MNSLLGLKVIESPLCVRKEPKRIHRKRRNQTDNYHRRIQKKWTKRFGEVERPCAYMINDRHLLGVGRALMIHPSLAVQLRNMR